MSYVDELFPVEISKGSRGGPRMSMSVTEADSGAQERARRWPSYRWEFDVGVPVARLDLLDPAYRHYLSVGVENSFPYKDINDFNSTASGRDKDANGAAVAVTNQDQVIGIGDGTTATFQLIKSYVFGTRTYVRNIRKPVSGTVVVSVDGVAKTLGTHFTVSLSTGEVTFTAGNIPTSAQIVRAGFEFRVPVFYGAEFVYKTERAAVLDGRIPEMMLVEDVSQGAVTPEFLYGGSGETVAISTDVVYDYSWGSSVFLNPSVNGLSVRLPDINDLPFGGPLFWFYNLATSGPKTIAFKHKATAATEFSLTFSTGAAVLVQRDTGDVRKWLAT